LLANAAELARHGVLQKSRCTEFLNQASRAPLEISSGVVSGQQVLVDPTPYLGLQTGMIMCEER
jgi:hypothetical protein